MSLEIKSEPFEISFADNQIIFELFANNLYQGAKALPYIEFDFNTYAQEGEAFEFGFIDPQSDRPITVRFRATPYPDDSGEEFGTLLGITFEIAIENIYKKLKLNPIVGSYFNLSYDGSTTIKFEAKTADIRLIPINLDYALLSLPEFAVATISDIVVSPDKRANYRAQYEVFFEKDYLSGDFEQVTSGLSNTPSIDGDLTLDISDILSSEIRETFLSPPIPSVNETDLQKGNLIRRYYISYSEYYDGIVQKNKWTRSKTKLVHCGGVSLEDFSKQNPFDYLTVLKKFATWQPDLKTLTPNQNDWLTWINYSNDEGGFHVEMKVYFNDETDTGFNSIGSISLDKWNSVVIPVGYTQRDIESLESGNSAYLVEYKITRGAEDKSSTARYMIDHTYQASENSIIYLNSYCAAESFNTSGEWEEILETKKTVVDKTLAPNYKLIDGQRVVFESESSIKYIGRTGYINQDHLKWLKGLLSDTETYLLKGNLLIPIIIEQNSFVTHKFSTHVNALQFNVVSSFKLNLHSNSDNIPTWKLDYDCGIKGIKIDGNGWDVIGTFAALPMDFTEPDGVTTTTIAYNSVYGGFEFPNKLDLIGDYSAEFGLSVVGHAPFFYDIKITNVLKHFYLFIDDWASFNFFMAADPDLDIKIDYEVIAALKEVSLTSGFTEIVENIPAFGKKRIDIMAPCLENVSLFSISDKNVEETPDFSLFKNVTAVGMANCGIGGYLDVSMLSKTAGIFFENNNLTNIDIGFHPDLQSLKINDNQLAAIEIERILLKIWDFRDYYSDPSTMEIYLAGNPGAASMTDKALEVINGTGDYVGEGLATDYSITIFY
jgi:hypothetical protein